MRTAPGTTADRQTTARPAATKAIPTQESAIMAALPAPGRATPPADIDRLSQPARTPPAKAASVSVVRTASLAVKRRNRRGVARSAPRRLELSYSCPKTPIARTAVKSWDSWRDRSRLSVSPTALPAAAIATTGTHASGAATPRAPNGWVMDLRSSDA